MADSFLYMKPIKVLSLFSIKLTTPKSQLTKEGSYRGLTLANMPNSGVQVNICKKLFFLAEHRENMLCTNIGLNLTRFELGIFMY